jgi:hypothetical protein
MLKDFDIKIHPTHLDIKFINKTKISTYTSFDEFYDLLYLSLDDEINARTAQIYSYLYSLKIKDENILFDKIKETDNWKSIQMLKNFNYEKFIQNNIESVGLNSFIKITNEIVEKFKDKDLNRKTKMLYFLEPVNNLQELNKLYKNWSKYFFKKGVSCIDKYKFLIKEVIEDLNGNRPWNENFRCDDPMIY